MSKAIHCFVSGRVQGVGYRNWTRKQGQELNLAGWVRNLDDGRVELVAQGKTEALTEFATRLSKGPLFARVDEIKQEQAVFDDNFTAFQVIR